MKLFENKKKNKTYTFTDLQASIGQAGTNRMVFPLDEEKYWFLSVFFHDTGKLNKFSLDEEAANDSHYEFKDEAKVRAVLYKDGDENKYLHEIFYDYIKENSGNKLLAAIRPYITAQFHYD